jgi:MFS family permease
LLSPFQLLCATGLLAIFSATISKSPVLPLFAAHLGATSGGVGLIAAISAFAGVVFSVPAGLLADRFGRKRLLVASALIFALAPWGYLLVATLWQLALIRFAHGFATAIFVPVAMAMVSTFSASERGEKMGWFSTATLLGRFLAPLAGAAILGALVLSPARAFQAVYMVCAMAGGLTLLLAANLPVDTAGGQAQSWSATFRHFKAVVLHRAILLTSLVEAAILFGYGAFETFLPLHVLAQGMTAYEIGLLLAAQVITLALTKPFMGRFSDRHGRRPQIIAGALFGSLCLGLLGQATTLLPLLCLSIAFGLGLSIVTSATASHIADLSHGRARGSAMGLLGSIMDIGHTTGPLVAGCIAAAHGYGSAFRGAGLVLLLTGLIFLCLGKSREGGEETASTPAG